MGFQVDLYELTLNVFRRDSGPAATVSGVIRAYGQALKSDDLEQVKIMNFHGTHVWTIRIGS
ncbi:MAG: hypothetical protein QXM16_03215 [Nitrososphaerota archaeon]